MNKKNLYMAAAAIALTGTVGMATWLSAEGDELKADPVAAVTAAPGVNETEAAIAAQPPVTEAVFEAPEGLRADDPAPARIGGRVPIVPARRTPIADEPARASRDSAAANRTTPTNPEPRTEQRERVEPSEPAPAVPAAVEPTAPRFVELVVPANAVLGLRLSTGLSSDTAEIEDRVEATVTRDVIANGYVAIPAGTKVLGSVNEVTRGGKFKERARLGVRFHTLVLGDGIRETIKVDAIVREGESQARESAAKIGGGAIGGAIIGGIIGGKKGAILGGAAGAGAGTAAVAAGDRSVAALSAGSPLSVRLDAPVTIKREQ